MANLEIVYIDSIILNSFILFLNFKIIVRQSLKKNITIRKEV